MTRIRRQGLEQAPGLDDLYMIPAKNRVVSLTALLAEARAAEAQALAKEKVALWQAAHPGEVQSAPQSLKGPDGGGPGSGNGARLRQIRPGNRTRARTFRPA